MRLACRFVHVKLAVDFDLDAVPVLRRFAVAPNQFHALVGVVVFDRMAKTAQVLADQKREGPACCGAIAIPNDKVGMRKAGEIRRVA